MIQTELHERFRSRAAGMSASLRAEYSRSLPPRERKLFNKIVREESQRAVRPNPAFAALDQAWGRAPARATARTQTQLIGDAGGVAPRPGKPKPGTRPASGLYPRESAAMGRVTSLSPHAAETHARVGARDAVRDALANATHVFGARLSVRKGHTISTVISARRSPRE